MSNFKPFICPILSAVKRPFLGSFSFTVYTFFVADISSIKYPLSIPFNNAVYCP